MGKKKGTRPKQQNAVPTRADAVSPNLSDFNFWRGLAHEIAPGEKDPWKIGEIASVAQQVCTQMGSHWRKISSIADKTEDKSVKFGLSVEISRINTPPEVSVKISGSEKWGDGGTVKVPDPDQTELPMEIPAGGKPSEPEGGSEETPHVKGE